MAGRQAFGFRRLEGRKVRPFACSAAVIAVAIGIGRFAYTPLLVLMQRDAGLSVTMAGVLASTNLAGYLAGALAGLHPLLKARPRRTIAVASIGIVLLTAAMALPAWAWLPARFLTGGLSGIVFVSLVSLVLHYAAAVRSHLGIGVFFSGVGLGIAGAGAFVPVFASFGGSRGAWVLVALMAAVLLAIALPGVPEPVQPAARAATPGTTEEPPRGFARLALVYTVEGAAYIIPATFIVAMIAENATFARYSALTWIVVGLVAAPSTTMWTAIARRWGMTAALADALIVQGVALLAPWFVPAPFDALVVAVGLGATFLGITALTNALGRIGRADGGVNAVALLTVLYGIGQLAGPLIATHIVLLTDSYRPAVAMAGAALLATTALFVSGTLRTR
jgi:predicted MFS family arabinose efflux permease